MRVKFSVILMLLVCLVFLLNSSVYSAMEFNLSGNNVKEWKSLISKAMDLDREGKGEEALATFQKAEDFAEQAFGKESFYYAESLGFSGTAFFGRGNYSKAEVKYRTALEIIDRSKLKTDRDIVPILAALAIIYNRKGDNEKAEIIGERALRAAESRFGRDDPGITPFLFVYGNIQVDKNNYQKAEKIYDRILFINRFILDKDTIEAAGILSYVSTVFMRINKQNKAESLLIRMIRIYENNSVTDNSILISPLNDLASIKLKQEKYREARELYLKSLKIAEKNYGVNDFRTAYVYEKLGFLYQRLLDHKKAVAYLEKSLNIFEMDKSENYDSQISILISLARIYTSLDNFDKSNSLLLKASELLQKSKSGNVKTEIEILELLGYIHKRFGRLKKAEEFLLRAYDISLEKLNVHSMEHFMVMADLTDLYETMGNYKKAESYMDVFEKSLQTYENKNSYDYCMNLEYLAWYCEKKGDMVKAEALNLESLKKKEELFGQNNLKVAFLLGNIGAFYSGLGDYDNAERYYNRALTIVEKVKPRPGKVQFLLINYASYCSGRGRFEEAEKIGLEISNTIKDQFGRDTIMYADSKITLANFKSAAGKYDEAEKLLKEALEIYARIIGVDAFEYLSCEYKYAIQVLDKGDHEKARQMLTVLYNKMKKNSYHRELFHKVLSKLAEMNLGTSRFREAEMYLEEYINSVRKNYGENRLEYAAALDLKAEFDVAFGRYKEAEANLNRALEIRRNILRPEHPDVSFTIFNIGIVYFTMGKLEEARENFLDALKNQKAVLSDDNVVVIYTETNLADVYLQTGRFEEAEELLDSVIAKVVRRYGKDHFMVYAFYGTLGRYYRISGDLQKAESYFLKSLEGIKKSLSGNTDLYLGNKQNLAELYAVRKEKDKALKCYNESIELARKKDRLAFNVLAENRKIEYILSVQNLFYNFLSFVTFQYPENLNCRITGLDFLLTRKGAVIDAVSKQREEIKEIDNPQINALLEKRQALSSKLSTLILKGTGFDNPESYKGLIQRLTVERERLEKELLKLGYKRFNDKNRPVPDSFQVAKKLPEKSILIEFVLFRKYEFNKGQYNDNWKEWVYAAYILPSIGKNGGREDLNPQVILLGNAAEINEAVTEYHKEMNRAKTHWKSGVLNEKESEEKLAVAGRKIYKLVFAPLREKIGKTDTLYISPDGLLNIVPFGALKDEDDQYLIEKYKINYLSSGKDLLSFGIEKKNKGDCVIIAAPDYYLSEKKRLESVGKIVKPEQQVSLRGNRVSGSLRGAEWKDLPQTKLEAEAISGIFGGGVRKYVGDRALEEVVKNLSSPSILHIATHGFFLKSSQNMGVFTNFGTDDDNLWQQKKQIRSRTLVENPLLKSGLILAGANSLHNSKSSVVVDDGILTALEISELELKGTDLVVLSACETGQGDIFNGEGVYGLRRAFQLAGARTVVMSLWSVPDLETKELMVGFYTRLKNGESKARALQNAELAMMKKRRKEKGAAHPFFWASFISVGEP